MISNLVSGFDLPLLFDCRVLHTIVYFEAVWSAILATAWLLVLLVLPHCVLSYTERRTYITVSSDALLHTVKSLLFIVYVYHLI